MVLPGRPVDRRRWFVYLVCVLLLVGVAEWAFTHPFNGWSLIALLGSLVGIWGLLRFDAAAAAQSRTPTIGRVPDHRERSHR